LKKGIVGLNGKGLLNEQCGNESDVLNGRIGSRKKRVKVNMRKLFSVISCYFILSILSAQYVIEYRDITADHPFISTDSSNFYILFTKPIKEINAELHSLIYQKKSTLDHKTSLTYSYWLTLDSTGIRPQFKEASSFFIWDEVDSLVSTQIVNYLQKTEYRPIIFKYKGVEERRIVLSFLIDVVYTNENLGIQIIPSYRHSVPWNR
jgi:hypothetical protein